MSSIKIILRSRANKDGTHPLVLQIIKDRRKTVVHIGQSVKKDQWDAAAQRVKKSHPNHDRLNKFLIKKLYETNNKVLEVETQKEDASILALKQMMKPFSKVTFFNHANIYIERLKQDGKYHQYNADKSRVKVFREFIGNDIMFGDITVGLLERFKAHIKATRKINERSALNYLVTIRSIFSQAIRDCVVDPKYYPFGKGKVKIRFPKTIKIGLTPEEIKSLETVELKNDQQHHARNIWLTSFYFAGMRVSDVLRMKWSDMKDGRLYYAMGKNGKADSLKIPDKALMIFEQYKHFKESNGGLVFPDLKKVDLSNKFIAQREISTRTNFIDKLLREDVARIAGIEKKFTMHIARHSFAQNAKDIDVRTLQKLFRHSNLATTEGYMGDFIHHKADEALDAVLNMNPLKSVS